MQKKCLTIAITFLSVAILCILFHSCFSAITNYLYDTLENRDWRVELNNGYYIQQVNGNQIMLIKNDWTLDSNVVINNYIVAYCYNNDFAGFICKSNEHSKNDDTENLLYLVDLQDDILFGPFTNEEYNNYCSENQINISNQWIYTLHRPEEAEYG